VIERPEQFISHLPEWHGATFSRLKGGFNNNTLKVTKETKVGVLKIDSSPRKMPFNPRCKEAYIQNIAYENGLAPKVIFANSGVYFTEFVEGVVGNKKNFKNENNLKAIAIALKKLHSLPLAGQKFNAMAAARKYIDIFKGYESCLVRKCLKIIDEAPLSSNFCLCHNDLVANNFIITPEIAFLDWEYSSDNNPFFDLATVVEHHELNNKEASLFLDAYIVEDFQDWQIHLKFQRRLYLALLYLWMISRHDINHTEIESIALRLTTIDL
tara:strand:- start:1043 stop:1849 length:807 start_codon:yes stop_codon:yes gene_type:complete